MNHLTNYANTDDPLNKSISDNLEAGRPGGSKVDLYLGNEPTLNLTTNNLTLLSSQKYPYTALGPIGVLKLVGSNDNPVVSQIVNRHAVNPSNRNAAQLVLLDTQGRDEISQALRRDARYTGGTSIAHSLFDSTNTHVQWLLSNRTETIAAFEAIRQTGMVTHSARKAWGHYQAILEGGDNNLLQEVRNWLFGPDYSAGWGRFKRNDVKSGDRLSRHYSNLGSDVETEQARTAARGEYAASKLLITAYGADYQMKMGKSDNGGRPNGIDQIWVKRDRHTGNVIEYLIVEAKGSVNATLGHPSTGQQMSPRWLFFCLVKMVAGDARYMDIRTSRDLPTKILYALINNGGIPVRGIIFHSLFGSKNESKVVEMTDIGLYSFVSAFERASAGFGVFTNAPTQQFIAFQ